MLKKLFLFVLLKYDPIRFCRYVGINIGRDCRLINVDRATFGSEPYLISIGSHVTITSGVRFITHDGGVWVFREDHPNIDVFGPIYIGDNVFIGLNTIILPNTHVQDNVVIGAGSVVTGNLVANSVYAGVPAKRIMSVSEYREKIFPKSENVRSMHQNKKKKYLKQKYLD